MKKCKCCAFSIRLGMRVKFCRELHVVLSALGLAEECKEPQMT